SVGSRGVGSGDAKPVGRNAHGPSALRSFGFWEQWRGTTITGRKEKDRGHSCPRGATRGGETARGLAVLGRVMANPWAGMPTVLRSFGPRTSSSSGVHRRVLAAGSGTGRVPDSERATCGARRPTCWG